MPYIWQNNYLITDFKTAQQSSEVKLFAGVQTLAAVDWLFVYSNLNLLCDPKCLTFLALSQNMEPTPRTDRISKDYKKEYPSIEIEGRRTIKKKGDTKKNIENVKLDGEVELMVLLLIM